MKLRNCLLLLISLSLVGCGSLSHKPAPASQPAHICARLKEHLNQADIQQTVNTPEYNPIENARVYRLYQQYHCDAKNQAS